MIHNRHMITLFLPRPLHLTDNTPAIVTLYPAILDETANVRNTFFRGIDNCDRHG